MRRSKVVVIIALFSAITVVISGLFQYATADRYSSSHYIIDASTGNSFGGAGSSASYKLVSSGGESIIGDGSGGSYKLGQGYVAQLQQALQMTIQPGNQAAYYPLDESTGTSAGDATVQSNTGVLVGAPTWTTGKIGNALSFNGTSQRVTIPHSTQNNLETLTVSVWIKTSQVPGAETTVLEKWGGFGQFPYSFR